MGWSYVIVERQLSMEDISGMWPWGHVERVNSHCNSRKPFRLTAPASSTGNAKSGCNVDRGTEGKGMEKETDKLKIHIQHKNCFSIEDSV